MTTHGANAGLPGELRLGERSVALPPPAGVEDAGAGVDRGARGNGTLSPVNLTYHIEGTRSSPAITLYCAPTPSSAPAVRHAAASRTSLIALVGVYPRVHEGTKNPNGGALCS